MADSLAPKLGVKTAPRRVVYHPPQHMMLRISSMQSYSVAHPIDTYQIGIICALPIELTAVKATFDEEHAPLPSKDGKDENSYALGRVGAHNIVAAGLPAGSYGIASATTVSKDMLRTFPRLRYGLLVGIGGGIPDPTGKPDIRLGDVVVSQPNTTYGGVVQYDLGKLLHDGTFTLKGSLNKPPLALLTALTNLQADLDGSPLATHLKDVYRRHPFLKEKGYTYPSLQQDHLHCTKCDPSRCWWWILWVFIIWLWPPWRCYKCENGQVRRVSRPKTTAAVHYGIIASANTVLRNARKRDQLRAETGALCVEMEAAGLMDSFPCLVIRGICDYADGLKDDVWQRYAALTAAVFAKHLLSYISPQTTEREKPVLEVLGKLDQYLQRQEVHNVAQDTYHQRQEVHQHRQEARHQDDRHRECHRVFKTSDYEGQKDINPDAVPGTCHWVLDHRNYQSWLNSTMNDLLWISADPGCGKSVLTKLLVDKKLRCNGDTGHTVCYFFFKDNEQQNIVSTALCAILHQLFSQQPNLIHHALPMFDKSGDRLQRNTTELWRIIQSAASDARASPITCVLDALDECRELERARLINLLCQSYNDSRVMPSSKNPLKWLVTSRPYDDVYDRFGSVSQDLPSIRLRGEDESDQIRDEINLVINKRWTDLSRELHLPIRKTAEVLDRLLKMEHRTYLWLYLAIESIRDTLRDALRPSDQELLLVPTSVEEAYERILSKVTSTQRAHAKAVLTIIVGARRPLTLREVALALDVLTRSQPPQALDDLDIDVDWLSGRIRQWCGLFVLISDGRLYLIHQTAREFLLNHENDLILDDGSWKHSLPLLKVEMELAMVCIRYLCLSDFNKKERRKNRKHNQKRPEVQTFFDFAAEHWASYTQPIEDRLDEVTRTSMKALYDTSSKRWTHWTSVMWRNHWNTEFGMNHIQLAAYNGHSLLLKEFLDVSPRKINSRDMTGRTSLVWASERGHYEASKLLIDAGANVNLKGSRGDNALHGACLHGHEEIARMLLSAGAHATTRFGPSWAVWTKMLDVYCVEEDDGFEDVYNERGSDLIAQFLLDTGANTIMRSKMAETLQIASWRVYNEAMEATFDHYLQGKAISGDDFMMSCFKHGHDKMVERFFCDGVHLISHASEPLNAASQEGHQKIVQMLLRAGADVNARGPYNNALHAASQFGHKEVVRMLLDAGAKIEDEGGRSALFTASSRGHKGIVRMLLDAGADVNDGEGCSALAAASGKSDEELVQMLLDAGADVNLRGTSDYDGPPLCVASRSGHEKTVLLLLAAGADVEGRVSNEDMESCIALALASRGGHEKIVQALLDAGADVNARSGLNLSTALQEASAEGHYEVVQMLLDAGADINARKGEEFSAALQGASGGGHDKIVQLLLGMRADVHAQDEEMLGHALPAASARGSDKVVRILLDAGANINAQGCYRDSSLLRKVRGNALQAASGESHDRVVEMLLEAGADVNARSGCYGTALHAASAAGRDKVVQMLLEAGANISAQGYYSYMFIDQWVGASALQAALHKDHDEVVQLLRRHGATDNPV